MGSSNNKFLESASLQNLPATTNDYLVNRYVPMTDKIYKKYLVANFFYHIFTNFITGLAAVATILAALSGSSYVNDAVVYWMLLIIPPLIIMLNKIMYLSNIPKIRVVYDDLHSKLEAEGQYFLRGVKNYAMIEWNDRTTIFVERIEGLKLLTSGLSNKDAADVSNDIVGFASRQKNINPPSPNQNDKDKIIINVEGQ